MTPVSSPSNPLRWPRLMELGLAFVLGVFALLLAQYGWGRLGPASRPTTFLTTPAADGRYRLDLNQADAAELAQLPGIGPELAERIVRARRAEGGFGGVDDLRRVSGIGPVRVERLRPFVAGEPASPDDGAPSRPATSRKVPPARPIDLNTADREDLLSLPGIGPVLADRILADRQANGPFRRAEDLKRVRGIKDKTFEKLAPYIRVEPPPAGRPAA